MLPEKQAKTKEDATEISYINSKWLRRDLNPRPSGYEEIYLGIVYLKSS